MPEWYSGEWKKRGFEGLWAIEGLFSAALRPSTQPITASMERAGTRLDGGLDGYWLLRGPNGIRGNGRRGRGVFE